MLDHGSDKQSQILLERLLSLRPGSSPFTLVLDTLEQSSKTLVKEYIRRANVFLSFSPIDYGLRVPSSFH